MKAPATAAAMIAGPILWAALAAPAVADGVRFKRDIVPLLKVRCAVCHLTGEEPGNMALHPGAAYKSLVGVQSTESPLMRVKPRAPEQSYIVRKLEGTHLQAGGKGVRMPMDGEPLAPDQIQLFRDWIAKGARNN